MKQVKKILILFFLLVGFLSFVRPVEAHVLKTDGSIGAVLHVDPEDDPIAGQQSGFYFDIKDKSGQFSPQQCQCTFTISQNGQELAKQRLFTTLPEPSTTNSSVYFTFPQKGIYQVALSGKPYTTGGFQPFTITYDVRVERVANQSSATSRTTDANQPNHTVHIIVYGALSLIIFGLIGYTLWQKRQHPQTSSQDQPRNPSGPTPLHGLILFFLLTGVLFHTVPVHLIGSHHDQSMVTQMLVDHPCCIAQVMTADPIASVEIVHFIITPIMVAEMKIVSQLAFEYARNKSPPTILPKSTV